MMSSQAGMPGEARRRPWNSTLAIWALYALVIICEVVLTRGFLLAASADSAVFTGSLGPQSLTDVSQDLLRMMVAWTKGAFHPSHLESWERSSLPMYLVVVGAVTLSVFLRKQRRRSDGPSLERDRAVSTSWRREPRTGHATPRPGI